MTQAEARPGRLAWAAKLVVAALAVLAVAAMLGLGGKPPSVPRAYDWQRGWFVVVVFALVAASPYYILFRLLQRKDTGRRDCAVYLTGAIAVAAFGFAFKAYAYSLGLIVCQLFMVGAVHLLTSVTRTRLRMIHAGLVALSLGASFAINYAIAPRVHMVQAEDYFGPAIPADVKQQIEYFYWIWDDAARTEAAHAEMRRQNPEWDMISRTFLGYSLANVALKYPSERERALSYLDKVIDSTVKVPWRNFLLSYGSESPFIRQPATSVMVDGEVSLLIGLRRLVRDEADYPHKELHRQLVQRCLDAMEAGPVLCGECYPDECWLWCNPLALTSARVLDILEGSDHSEFFEKWARSAATNLTDKETGLFNSAVTLDGTVIHAPEGSTIWIGASCLLPVAPGLAREQYARMKELLAGRLLFLAYGREWPRGKKGDWDIDSGFTPFGMGPASTGFALVASKEMGDKDFFVRLLTLLNLVGVPCVENGRLRYLSSNLVGDATFLLGKTTGPAWEEIDRRWKQRGRGQ